MIFSQPIIVAIVGLQSRPPPARKGKAFKTWNEVMAYIVQNEGVSRLWKGLGPQLSKALLVQGLLVVLKEQYVSQYTIQILRDFANIRIIASETNSPWSTTTCVLYGRNASIKL
jgi:hypothetical protein